MLCAGVFISCDPAPAVVYPSTSVPQVTASSTAKRILTPEPGKRILPTVGITPTQILQPTSQLEIELTPNRKIGLDAVLADGGEWHAVIYNPDGDLLYAHQADAVIHPASTIKTAIAMLVLYWLDGQDGGLERNMASGPANAGRSYTQLLQAMLVSSEEDAAQILQDAAVEGLGWGRINQLLSEWGAPNTRLVPRRSTALEMCHLLVGLYSRKLPSPQTSRIILDLMARQTQGDTVRLWKLKEVLPDGAIIYNKRGSLTDPVIVADTGIVFLPGRGPYYLCIFGYSNGDVIFEDLDQTIGDFAVQWYKIESESGR